MNIFFLLFLLLSFCTNVFAQNTEDCVRKHLDFLNCKSNDICSMNESDSYHINLIENYTYILNYYKDAVKPDDLNQLGKEYFYLKNNDSALYFYQLAHDEDDTNSVFINNIGTILFTQGLYDSSFNYFNAAYKLDTLQQDYINNLASYYGTKGDYKKAIDFCLKSLEINSSYKGNLLALNHLIITYRLMKNKPKVRQYNRKYKKYYKGKGTKTIKCDCECTKYLPDCDI